MSRVISNLLLSLSMIPCGLGIFFLTALILDDSAGMSDDSAFMIASGVLLVFVVIYWTCVWASSITWNESRVLRTVAAVAGALGVGIVVGLGVFAAVGPYDVVEMAIVFGSVAASTAWMIFSVLAWRETAADRQVRLNKVTTAGGSAGFAGILLCPSCGYDMKGLTQARCPECGTEYTLDSLLAANVERTEPDRELGTSPA